MELVLLVAAFVLFVIAAVWAWRTGPHPISLIASGLAAWVLSTFIGHLIG